MADFRDSRERIEALLVAASAIFRRRFLSAVRALRAATNLQEIERMLRQGAWEQALARAETEMANAGSAYASAYTLAAEDTAAFIGESMGITVRFDQVNLRAVQEMRANQFRLVQGLLADQRAAIQEVLVAGIQDGLNPTQQARLLRGSLGLSDYHVRAVQNYRRMLEDGSRESLSRALRDRRFDPTVERAAQSGVALDADQIDRMVERYQERMLQFRAEGLARTEALDSVHAGADESLRQAVDAGILAQGELTQEWDTSDDERVRASHQFMNHQRRPIGEPFVSGDGNHLMRPGDSSAPASERIRCRCVKIIQFSEDAPLDAEAGTGSNGDVQ